MASTLTILSWPDYINPATLEQFSAARSIEAKVEVVPSAVELLARMRESDPAIDILCPPDYVVRELGGEGRLLELDHGKLPNLRHLQPRFRHGRAHDPESRVSVVKDWGTTGLMFRADIVTSAPRSWADFWKLAEGHSGKATVLDSPGEVIGAALKMRGKSYNAADAESLDQARRDLLALKPHLRAFETNYRPLLQSGEAVIALGWNGDAAALKAGGTPIQYVVPNEGSQLWEDDWAIAAKSRHPDLAHAFLDFALSPEVAAQEARFTGYATANEPALAMLDEATRNDSSIYPSPRVLEKLESGMPLGEEGDRRRAALWAEIRG